MSQDPSKSRRSPNDDTKENNLQQQPSDLPNVTNDTNLSDLSNNQRRRAGGSEVSSSEDEDIKSSNGNGGGNKRSNKRSYSNVAASPTSSGAPKAKKRKIQTKLMTVPVNMAKRSMRNRNGRKKKGKRHGRRKSATSIMEEMNTNSDDSIEILPTKETLREAGIKPVGKEADTTNGKEVQGHRRKPPLPHVRSQSHDSIVVNMVQIQSDQKQSDAQVVSQQNNGDLVLVSSDNQGIQQDDNGASGSNGHRCDPNHNCSHDHGGQIRGNGMNQQHGNAVDDDDDNGDLRMEQQPPNAYTCAKCKHKYILTEEIFRSGKIKKYMVQYMCETCIKDVRRNDNIKEKRYITMRCLEHTRCNRIKREWHGINSVKAWKGHYRKCHPTEEYLSITGQKYCEQQQCSNVVANDVNFCATHNDGLMQQQQSQQNLMRTDGEYCILDGNGEMFDVRDILYLIDINEDLKTDEQKDVAGRDMIAGLKKLSKMNDDYGMGLEGLVELRMVMAARHYKAYRENNINGKKREVVRRVELLKDRKYGALNERVKQEQKKRNDKKDRQYRNKQRRRQERQEEDEQKMEVDEVKVDNNGNGVNVQQVLNSDTVIRNDGDLPYNTNEIAQSIDEFKYSEKDTTKEVKARINRACKLAKQGKWSKANAALDPGVIVDLNKNGNWAKTKSKFPHREPIQEDHENMRPKWNLTEEKVLDILKKINSASVGGPCGFNNELIKWMADRDATYGIAKVFRYLCKDVVERGVPGKMRDVMFFAKGLPLGKEKDGVKDHDVRPAVILDSFLRVMDRIIVVNSDPEGRREAVGEYQTMGMKQGCEIASVTMDYEEAIMDEIDSEAMTQTDAYNAFNTIDRQMNYYECKESMPDTINWYSALYRGPTKVAFDHNHELEMVQGHFQGMTSSQDYYSMGKKRILKKTEKEMKEKHKDFKIHYQTDCSDDGAQSMDYIYVPEYMKLLVKNYGEWNILINKEKTNIVLKTRNDLVKQYITLHCHEYKVDFEGNMTYLSVPHGTKAYVLREIDKHVKKLMVKLKHIEQIKSSQIRSTMYQKFMSLNKVIYLMRNTKVYKEWIEKFGQVYDYIKNSCTAYIDYPKVAEYQIQLSHNAGGLGMRNPRNYYVASRITALNNKSDIIPVFFRFDKLRDGDNAASAVNKYNRAYRNAKLAHEHELEQLVNKFNDFVQPQVLVLKSTTSHKDLLNMIDKKYRDKFEEEGSDLDKIRIRSLSTTGATSWLRVPVNKYYGQVYTNLEYYILISLLLGAKIIQQPQLCKRGCGKVCDERGHHAMHCSHGPYMKRRHNGVRDLVLKFGIQAGMKGEIEQKYGTMGGLEPEDRDMDDPVHGVPGDVKLCDYFAEGKDLYGDIVIGNVFAPSYRQNAVKERLWVAKKKEKEKRAKYNDPEDFVPLAMETMGALGGDFKRLLQKLADRTATRKNITYARIMNRMRMGIVSYVMKMNAQMIGASITL